LPDDLAALFWRTDQLTNFEQWQIAAAVTDCLASVHAARDRKKRKGPPAGAGVRSHRRR
jgi:hypothetical protein